RLSGVFAGGDAVTGPKTVIEAVAAGKVAAESIDLYLQGLDLLENRQFRSTPQEEIAPFPMEKNEVPQVELQHPSHVDAVKRSTSFVEVSDGLTREQAMREAERCLNCGICSECLECEKACLADAIRHDMQDEEIEINVGAVVLTPGFEKYDASALDYYGYGRYPNVLTSLEFERVLSASGPFQGHMVRPYDHKEPRKIAWIQCVGSRNTRENHGYCSSVCCMYAIKEAVIAKEHSSGPLEASIFFMDMRTYGKGFEKYYDRAREEKGVRFIRSRIFAVEQVDDDNKNLSIRYSDEDGNLHAEEFDMVILSLGMQVSENVKLLGEKLEIDLNKYGFAQTATLSGVETNKPGIFVAGSFSGPKDIPETVMQASAAAGVTQSLLADVRGTLVKEKEYPPERDVSGEEPRVGVFVCHCGINIGSVVNVPEVAESAKSLPNVVYSGDFLYVCSQDSQASIRKIIEDEKLNRVVVASCSPRTHKPLFQETMMEAGLNRYLFEMANIRDQCSWVHQSQPEKATAKAKDLVRMVVAKATLLKDIHQEPVGVTKAALVIGGGVSGMNSALSLADQGFRVHLVEKSDKLGGIARRISKGLNGEDVQQYLEDLVAKVTNNSFINLYTGTEVQEAKGFLGNFVTTLSDGTELQHGVAIVAIGGVEYKPTEYLYGQNKNVMTQLAFAEAIEAGDSRIDSAKNIVLIQCVGSREPERGYCSRVCCTKSVRLALELKDKNPDANVFILYRDIRTYGFFEDQYTEARRKGVIFIRYNVDEKPVVEDFGGKLKVTVRDHVLGQPIVIDADLVGLAAAILASPDNPRINELFKVPINEDGFFLEAHMKLRPVDFASEGIYMAGLAHGPKNIEENIAQARAAAGRASTVLSKAKLESHGVVAVVDKGKCAACLTCVRLCPYNAPKIKDHFAEIEAVICQGCGSCAGECPNKAITLQSYNDNIYNNMVNGLLKGGVAGGI
ncbi:MAG: FAD-dependent oxidoreductase, partial [Desulfocucumaceae bacterium]